MGLLNNSWLLLVAIVYGAYIAAILLVIFGVIAFVRAVRRWGRGGSAVRATCGIAMVICGVGSGVAMHEFLAGRYIIVPLIAGIVFLCIEAWVRSGDKVCNQTGAVNTADREVEQKKIEQTVADDATDDEKRPKSAEKALAHEDEREEQAKRVRLQEREDKAARRAGGRVKYGADTDKQYGE